MNEMETININEEEKRDYRDPSLTGIGGWLIVMLIGICISIINIIINLFDSFGYGLYSAIATSIYLPFLLLYIFVLITMIKKLHFFRIMYLIVILVFGGLSFFIDIFLGMVNITTIASALGTVLWAIYLLLSVRVRNTFVRNWRGLELAHKVYNDSDTQDLGF